MGQQVQSHRRALCRVPALLRWDTWSTTGQLRWVRAVAEAVLPRLTRMRLLVEGLERHWEQ